VRSLEIELTKEVIFLLGKYQNRCRAILPCDPKFFHRSVNGFATAKVRALPRVHVPP